MKYMKKINRIKKKKDYLSEDSLLKYIKQDIPNAFRLSMFALQKEGHLEIRFKQTTNKGNDISFFRPLTRYGETKFLELCKSYNVLFNSKETDLNAFKSIREVKLE